MKLRLWSIQEANKLDEIKSTGKLICTENCYSNDWDNEYRWMIDQMNIRIGKSEVKNQYPIWAWYQHQDVNKPKPDLRKSGYLPSETHGIRIEFEKNTTEVVLSDFVLWHYPLSYKSIVAKNASECNQFQLKLKRLKLDRKEFNDLPSKIKQEIVNSWQRIFDMDFEDKYYTHGKDNKMIQACCWDIKEKDILRIDKFIAR